MPYFCPAVHVLASLPNLVLSPHYAAFTMGAIRRMVETTIANLVAMAGEKARSGRDVPHLNWRFILFRWNDSVYALEDLCPHLGFPLSEGVVQVGEVICSWHGWHIRLEDGICRRERDRAKVFACEVRDGDVFVKI